jgi:hypothetical protein
LLWRPSASRTAGVLWRLARALESAQGVTDADARRYGGAAQAKLAEQSGRPQHAQEHE